MKEVSFHAPGVSPETATFVACVATILEIAPEEVALPAADEDAATGWTIMRWLGGRGLGMARVADAASFSWAGPWIARVAPASGGEPRAVVMYGVPSGVAWDPSQVTDGDGWRIVDGFVLAALDVALAPPPRRPAPTAAGTVEGIYVAPSAGAPSEALDSVRALAGRGLDGDRHVAGTGTFPSGLPGSALTLIEAEVCESFAPPLRPDEHRRNVVTRGIDLNGLVGHEFAIGTTRCRGMRLCEPCMVVERYASRPVLRALVHRGGLRADIIQDGAFSVGDAIAPTG